MSRFANSGKTWFSALSALGLAADRRLERNAAEQQRLQRLHLHFDPGAAELDETSRGVPKPGLVMHVAVDTAPEQRRGSSRTPPCRRCPSRALHRH